jgi:hypothetical protein
MGPAAFKNDKPLVIHPTHHRKDKFAIESLETAPAILNTMKRLGYGQWFDIDIQYGSSDQRRVGNLTLEYGSWATNAARGACQS